MHIQTILNRVEKFKSFTYGGAQLVEHDGGPALVGLLPAFWSTPNGSFHQQMQAF
jgi:hypothetical protein